MPAGKIVAVAKNYADHAKEMQGLLGSGAAGDQAPPADPVFFLKPTSCLVGDGGAVVIPDGVTNVHYETELAVVIGSTLKDATEEEAMAGVLGYAVFLDMTARDLQAAAKKAGMPWSLAKGMDTFGPISDVVKAAESPAWDAFELALSVNGEERQRGFTKAMTHSVPKLLAYASRFMTLEPGDIVATGTPAGVGPVKAGDRLDAALVGHTRLQVRVEAR